MREFLPVVGSRAQVAQDVIRLYLAPADEDRCIDGSGVECYVYECAGGGEGGAVEGGDGGGERLLLRGGEGGGVVDGDASQTPSWWFEKPASEMGGSRPAGLGLFGFCFLASNHK